MCRLSPSCKKNNKKKQQLELLLHLFHIWGSLEMMLLETQVLLGNHSRCADLLIVGF